MQIRRVVTTRAGGVSRGDYASFNLGDHVGDDPQAVAANRERLARTIGVEPESLIWMEQIHSRTVTVVDSPRAEPVPATDALVTTVPGLALAVLSADCVPVLIADAQAGVVAGVHAGRVGARVGIVPATLRAMVELGADPARMTALLGPAASGRHYEVPLQMQRDVEAHLPGSACRTAKNTPGLDLRAGICRQLHEAGVVEIDIDPRCTVSDRDLFSHRRGAPTGRLASVILMSPGQVDPQDAS